MKTVSRLLAVVLMAGTLGACMFHGGEPKYVSTTTLGQELSDLKAAFESGALTESEYRAMKEGLINSCSDRGHHHKRHGC